MSNTQKLIEQLLQTTTRLVELDESNMPSSIASGFILKRDERNILVTAGHSLRKSKKMAIETSVIFGLETLMFGLPPVNFVKKGDLVSGKFNDLDIAWVPFDPNEINNPNKKDDRLKGLKIQLPAYQGPIDKEPKKNRAYAFASWSKCEFHPAKNALVRDAVYELGMEYLGKDKNSGVYKFKLARNHQGHEYYRGSSGSPIADEEGRIVSIVLRGDEDDDLIYGFPLSDLAEIIESKEIE